MVLPYLHIDEDEAWFVIGFYKKSVNIECWAQFNSLTAEEAAKIFCGKNPVLEQIDELGPEKWLLRYARGLLWDGGTLLDYAVLCLEQRIPGVSMDILKAVIFLDISGSKNINRDLPEGFSDRKVRRTEMYRMFFGAKMAAKYLGISESTVYRQSKMYWSKRYRCARHTWHYRVNGPMRNGVVIG